MSDGAVEVFESFYGADLKLIAEAILADKPLIMANYPSIS